MQLFILSMHGSKGLPDRGDTDAAAGHRGPERWGTHKDDSRRPTGSSQLEKASQAVLRSGILS